MRAQVNYIGHHKAESISDDFSDLESLACGLKTGHMTKYMYFSGAHIYKDFMENCHDYYALEAESKLIRDTKAYSSSLQNIASVIELGPGTLKSIQNKTIPLLLSSDSINKYLPVDICQDTCAFAASYVKKILPNITTHPVSRDFSDSLSIFKAIPNKAIVFLGGTLGNFDDAAILRFLIDIKETMSIGDIFMASFDSNKDPEKLAKAYNNAWTVRLTTSPLLYFQERYPCTPFEESDLVPYYKWDAEASCVITGVTLKKDILFSKNTRTAHLQAGKEYHLISSRKFTLNQIEEYFHKAGLFIDKAICSPGQPIQLLITSLKV